MYNELMNIQIIGTYNTYMSKQILNIIKHFKCRLLEELNYSVGSGKKNK